MKWRIIAIVSIILLIIGALFPVIHHYQLRWATEKYIAQLESQGESLSVEQSLPPPVPRDQDGTALFRQAAAKMDDYSNDVVGMKNVIPGKAMIRWQQADIRDSYGTNTWANVSAAVARNTNALELLQRIIEKPTFSFNANYSAGIYDLTFTNLWLSESKTAANLLNAAALYDLHEGNTAEAVTNTRTMLALIQAMRDERLIISELVRMVMGKIAFSTTWEALHSPGLTDQLLAGLQQDWMKLDFVQSSEKAFRMERTTGEISLKKFRDSSSEMTKGVDIIERAEAVTGEDKTDKGKKIKIHLWQYWWSYPDELTYLKGIQIILNSMRSVETNNAFSPALSRQNSQLNQLGIDKIPDELTLASLFSADAINFHSFFASDVVSLAPIPKKIMQMEAAKNLAITAIALKRYELKHGEWPTALADLMPEFLPTIPADPADGKPLRYRKKDDGSFLLYSIGSDGHDDGGDPTSNNTDKWKHISYHWENFDNRDWVWPQPASAKEVQVYYSHLHDE